MSESRLEKIRVVLFETQNIVNVAATMRAMKNMGVSDLRMVNAVPFDAWRVQGIAHDTGDIMKHTREHAALDDAIGDCVLVTAFTHVVFFGEDRYHLFLSPLLCVLAAAALREGERAARAPAHS